MKSTTFVRLVGVAALGSIGILGPVASAGAAPYPNGGTPDVKPTTEVKAAGATKPASLPFTGGDVAQLGAIGAVSIGAGAFLIRRTRHRAA